MTHLSRECLINNLAKVTLSICEHCLMGKVKSKPFEKKTKESSQLQLVHTNICSLMSVRIKHKAVYFITFIDEFFFSQHGHVYFISHMYEAFNYFK